MPLILVVEPEGRYVERIRDALADSGWEVAPVSDAGAAREVAAARNPELMLVSIAADGADDLLDTYGRRNGKASLVALVPETRAPEMGSLARRSDACVLKPFTAQALRLAIQRSLAAPAAGAEAGAEARADASPAKPAASTPQAAPPSEPKRKLTSQDIFGDLIAEFEGEKKKASEAAAPAEPSPAAPTASRRGDDLDRKLEETLSGVLGNLSARPKETLRPPRPPAEDPLAGLAEPPRPKPRPEPKATKSAGDDALDELLSQKLGFDLSRPKTRTQAPAEPAPPLVKPEPGPTAPPAAAPQAAQPRSPAESTGADGIDLIDVGAESMKPPPADGGPGDDDDLQVAFEVEDADFSGLGEEVGTEHEEEPPRAGRQTDQAPSLGGRPTLPGTQFGQYVLTEKIAVGGMAEVWKARMQGVEGFQKTVAIKKILPHLNDNDAFVTMFIDEAKLAAQLNHQNIIHIYDLGRIDGDYFIAMEFVEGRNLRALLNETRRRGGRVPLGLALLIAARLASALDHAHRKKDFDDRDMGLVHRDVSPQNVLLSYEGDIKLCDFGIVKAVSKASHTQMGALKGKLQYMSPEQAWGKSVDARSDLFSLGALLFEILTGNRLFPGENEISVLESVREARVTSLHEVDPSVPAEVEAVVAKALAKDPDDRYQTAGEMQAALEELLHSLRPTPSQAELASFMRRIFQGPETDTPWDDLGSKAQFIPPSSPASRSGEVLSLGDDPDSSLTDSPSAASPPSVAAGAPGPKAAAEEKEQTGSGVSKAGKVLPPPPLGSPSKDLSEDAEPFTATETADGALIPPPPAQSGSSAGDSGESDSSDSAVEMVAPEEGKKVDLDEGGGRGRGLLIAAIVLLLLIIGAVWFFFLRPREAGPDETAPPVETVAPVSADETGSDIGDEASGDAEAATEGGEGEGEEGGADGTGAEGASAEGASGDGLTNVQQMVEEELARREEELRRKREAEVERLSQQLADQQARAEEEAPAPGEGDEPADGEADGEEAEESAAALEEARLKAEAEAKAERERLAEQKREQERLAEERRREQEAQDKRRREEEAKRKAEEANRVKPGDLVSLGPGVTPPELVSIDKPQYPPLARRLRVEGEVEVDVLVDEKGRVVEVKVTKPVPQNVGLNEAAASAARSARYRPAKKDGVPVKIWTTLKIPFKL